MPWNHLSRRELLAVGASGVAAAVLPRTSPAAEAASPTLRSSQKGDLPAFIKTSLAGYSFRKFMDTPGKSGEMSLLDLVDLCAKLGLDAVEPTSYYFLKDDDEFIYALKRRAYLAGVEISGLPINTNFAQATEKLPEVIAHVKKWTDISVKLGAPNMRIFAGKPSDLSREKAFANAIPAMKEACSYAGSKGVFLAIENHGYLTETAEDVIKVVEAVDHPWLGVNLDTGNFHEKPYENMAKLIPHAVVCQVKTQVAGDGPKQRKPADYGRIFQILREAKYRGYVALEYEGDKPHEEVPVEIAKIKAALKG